MVGPQGSGGDEMLESENQYRLESLTHKVSRLKTLVVDIETETKDHHSLINGLGTDFEAGQSLLSNSFGRFKKVVNSRHTNRRAMCYVIMVLLTTFFLLYYAVNFFKR
ncbi:BET1-like protein [Ischnura elegans]|uniref:BET1-like protein n=1 Tax=Ischnura elegans TaxID=197161 RepID=UPI001ED8871B|nr:BET1-like protein [Ischnura elegans]